MDEIAFEKTGTIWEVWINGHNTEVQIADFEHAAAVRIGSRQLVTYFMKTLDGERWNRFKAAYERFKK